MLSTLSQGVGHWNGDVNFENAVIAFDQDWLPPPSWDGASDITAVYQNYRQSGRETPRSPHSASSQQSQSRSAGRRSPRFSRTARTGSARSQVTDKADGEMILPKTFLTRRGALMLFVAPEKIVPGLTAEEASYVRQRMQETTNFANVGSHVNSVKQLFDIILAFGQKSSGLRDEDEGKTIMMKFLRGLDERAIDVTTQPGGDFTSYVKDVKSITSVRPTTSNSVHFYNSIGIRDTLLDKELGRSRSSSRQTARSNSDLPQLIRRDVLLSDKLAASVRSLNSAPSPSWSRSDRSDLTLVTPDKLGSSAKRPRPDGRSQVGASRRARMSPDEETEMPTMTLDHGFTTKDRLLQRPQSSRPTFGGHRLTSGVERPGSAWTPTKSETTEVQSDRADAAFIKDANLDDEYTFISEEAEEGAYDGKEFVLYEGDVMEEIIDAGDEAGDSWSDEAGDSWSDEENRMHSSLARSRSRTSVSVSRTFNIEQTRVQSRDPTHLTIDNSVQMLPHNMETLLEYPPYYPDDADVNYDSVSESERLPSHPNSRQSPDSISLQHDLPLDEHDLPLDEHDLPLDEDIDVYINSDDFDLDPDQIDADVDSSSMIKVRSGGSELSRVSSRASSSAVASSRGSRRDSKTLSRPSTGRSTGRSMGVSTAADKPDARVVSEALHPASTDLSAASLSKDARIRSGSVIGLRQVEELSPDHKVTKKNEAKPGEEKLSSSSLHDGLRAGVSAPVSAPVIAPMSAPVRHDEVIAPRLSHADILARSSSVKSPQVATEKAADVVVPNLIEKAEKSSRIIVPKPPSVFSRPVRHVSSTQKKSARRQSKSKSRAKNGDVITDQHIRKFDDAAINNNAQADEANDDYGYGEKGEEGMTIEELELEKKILEARMKQAEENLGKESMPRQLTRKASSRNLTPKKSGKKHVTLKIKEVTPEEELEKQREALKEQKQIDKTRRLEEAMLMQQRIREKEEEKKKDLISAETKRKDLESQMRELAQEAEEAEELEEEVKLQMAAARRAAREERMARRKADIERRKQEAIARRQRERTMVDKAREREIEMLSGIMDAESKLKMWEDEKNRQAEADRLHEEKLEEELNLAMQAAEDDERRILHIEAQTEEETLAKIRKDRDEADMRRRKLAMIAEGVLEEEECKRRALLEEQMKVANETRRQLDVDKRQRDEERDRLLQLQQMELEARERLRVQMELRRQNLILRREKNLETRNNLDGIRHSQDVTRPWVFSYYVIWPRSTYERPIGGESDNRPRTGAGRRTAKSGGSAKSH